MSRVHREQHHDKPASSRVPGADDRKRTVREKARAMYRDAVLEAAEQVFSLEGIRGSRIQDIATQAGVSVGTVYNHFAQKEDIVVALMVKHDHELILAFTARNNDPSDFAGALRSRHDRLLRLVEKHIRFYSFALYEGLLSPDATTSHPNSTFGCMHKVRRERIGELVEELLRQGLREGVVKHKNLSRLKCLYDGTLMGMMIAVILNPKLSILDEGRALLDLYLSAICTESPPNPANT